jgi:Spy/CpxP family protein refolding chaperone
MFKFKIFRYFVVTAAVVATSSAILTSSVSLQSQAQPQTVSQMQSQFPNPDKNPERPNMPDMPSGRMLRQLNLSLDQLQKLKAVRDRDQDRIRELAQRSRTANRELRDLLASADSSDVIRAKHSQVQNLHQELQKQHFERMLAMREVLTPQQRAQLNEIMQKNHPRMKDNIQNRLEKRMDRRENLRDR